MAGLYAVAEDDEYLDELGQPYTHATDAWGHGDLVDALGDGPLRRDVTLTGGDLYPAAPPPVVTTPDVEAPANRFAVPRTACPPLKNTKRRRSARKAVIARALPPPPDFVPPRVRIDMVRPPENMTRVNLMTLDHQQRRAGLLRQLVDDAAVVERVLTRVDFVQTPKAQAMVDNYRCARNRALANRRDKNVAPRKSMDSITCRLSRDLRAQDLAEMVVDLARALGQRT